MEGVCPVQTYCRQGGGGFFRGGRPHFLVKKLRIFRNLWWVRTDKGVIVLRFCVFYGWPLRFFEVETLWSKKLEADSEAYDFWEAENGNKKLTASTIHISGLCSFFLDAIVLYCSFNHSIKPVYVQAIYYNREWYVEDDQCHQTAKIILIIRTNHGRVT